MFAKLALIAAILVSAVACAADKTVTNTELGFELTVPDTWHVHGNWCFYTEAPGGLVIVDVHMEDATALPAYVERKTAEITAEKDSKISGNSEVILGGVKGVKIAYKIGAEEGAQYLLIANGHGYVVKSTVNAADSPKFAAIIDAVLKSFKIVEKK